jgi:hypothetical protein
MNRNLALLAAFCAVLVPSGLQAQRGMRVAPRDLTQITQDAKVILRGRVVGVAVQQDATLHNMYTVVVTLKVDEALKGQPGTSFTFSQFIWDLRDRQDAAGYRKGQELLLFMNAPNAQGLSSPTGMSQGRFDLQRKPDGSVVAMNGTGNAHLFRGTAERINAKALTPRAAALVTSAPPGPVPLKELQQIISALLEVKQ